MGDIEVLGAPQIIERPDMQPGKLPGQLVYARIEDGILWLYQDTPATIKRRIISHYYSKMNPTAVPVRRVCDDPRRHRT